MSPNTTNPTILTVTQPAEGVQSMDAVSFACMVLGAAFGREIEPGTLRAILPVVTEPVPVIETAFNWPTGAALVEHDTPRGPVRTVYLFDARELLKVGEPLPPADRIGDYSLSFRSAEEAMSEDQATFAKRMSLSPDVMLTHTAHNDGDSIGPKRVSIADLIRFHSITLDGDQVAALIKGETVTIEPDANPDGLTHLLRLADPDAHAFEVDGTVTIQGSADDQGDGDEMSKVHEAEAQADAEAEGAASIEADIQAQLQAEHDATMAADDHA